MIDFAKWLNRPLPPPPIVPRRVVGITGHRPHKLDSKQRSPRHPHFDGYDRDNPLRVWLRQEIRSTIERIAKQYRLPPFAHEIAAICTADADSFDDYTEDDIARLEQAARGEPHYAVFQALSEARALCRRDRSEQVRLRELADKLRPDRFRAQHLDSYLRQVAWKPGVDYHAIDVLGVSGVALGVDQDFCGVLARLNPPMPYVAAVPFPGQESRWPLPSRKVYAAVLEHAAGIVYVSTSPPRDDDEAKRMMGERNDWIGCVVDELVAVWDSSPGGTANCIRGFRRLGKQPHIIDPRDYVTTPSP